MTETTFDTEDLDLDEVYAQLVRAIRSVNSIRKNLNDVIREVQNLGLVAVAAGDTVAMIGANSLATKIYSAYVDGIGGGMGREMSEELLCRLMVDTEELFDGSAVPGEGDQA